MIIPKEIKEAIILKQQRSVGDFASQLQDEYSALIPYLPPHCNIIWDIGAGLGGIDIFLSKHYPEKPDIYLTDYDRVDDNVFFGFNQKYCAYNQFSLTKKLLDANEIENYYFDMLDEVRRLPYFADIIISLLSCGFHYPVSTYVNDIIQRSVKGTVLILDMRTGHDQREILSQYFETVALLPYRKWARYIGVRK